MIHGTTHRLLNYVKPLVTKVVKLLVCCSVSVTTPLTGTSESAGNTVGKLYCVGDDCKLKMVDNCAMNAAGARCFADKLTSRCSYPASA